MVAWWWLLVVLLVGIVIGWFAFAVFTIGKQVDLQSQEMWQGYYIEAEEKHNKMLEEKEKENGN